jgi:hypothetical protein
MLREEIKNIKSGRRELRGFGLTFGVVAAAAGAVMLWKANMLYPYAFGAAALFIGLGLLWPFPLKPLQKIWMMLAVILGFVMSRIILLVLFFLILTPISLVARLFGKRFLDLRPETRLPSYWNRREPDPGVTPDYTKQY